MGKNWPEAVRNNAVGYGTVVFGGESVSYAILRRDVNENLPGFVGCFKKEEERFFFISDEVPPHFREPQVLHEIMEIQKLEECPGSCLASLVFELTTLADDIREKYLVYRRDFFRRLVSYCAAHPEWYPEQRVTDFRESLDYLEAKTK